MLAIPIAAVAGLVLGLQGRRSVALLDRRIAALERELARRPAAAPQPLAPTQPTPVTQAPERPAAVERRPAATGAAAPPPARSASAPPPRAPVPAEPGRSLEERLGARWSVIVGGLALALGGVFLVRYSIDQGLIGPAARVALGALFAAALLGFGERLRRKEAALGRPRRPIDIAAVVTSAGAASAFATIYAAYALYGFLGPAAAIIGLGVVAVATLLAAALHGPVLGALGLIGAYAAPLLVSGDEPNAYALFLYLVAPTAASFAVARLRNWPALAVAAGVGAFFWGAIAVIGSLGDAAALLVFAAALIALAALMHSGARRTPPEAAGRPDAVSSSLIALFGLLAAAAPLVDGFGAAALGLAGALLVGLLGLAAWAPGLAPVAVAGGLLAGLVALSFDDAALAAVAEATSLPAPGETPRSAGLGAYLAFSAAMSLLFLAIGAAAARLLPPRPAWRTGLLAAAAAGTPLLLLALAFWQAAELAPDLRFAALAVLLAAALAALAEDAARREDAGRASPAATAAYASGAAAALGLALAMAMREGALTVALAFLAMALGLAALRRPIKALGAVALAAAGLVLLRVILDPRIVGDELGATPVFNALLWGYGAPVAAFWIGARAFDRAGQSWPAQALEGLALLFALLLGFTQARHLAHGGDLTADGVRLVEAGLDATVAFGLAAAAGRLGLSRASPALRWGSLAAGALGAAATVAGLLLAANPAFTGEPVGDGAILNALLPGYLLPAIAALAAARFAGEGRPAWVGRAFGGAALALAFAYLTLSVRRAFVGPVLDGFEAIEAEWYAYSAAWLAFGLALLAAGVLRGSQTLRLASALAIVLVVLKVFLFDLAGLGGVWRALSFIGLGGVLVGVGLVYQRLLARPAPAA